MRKFRAVHANNIQVTYVDQPFFSEFDGRALFSIYITANYLQILQPIENKRRNFGFRECGKKLKSIFHRPRSLLLQYMLWWSDGTSRNDVPTYKCSKAPGTQINRPL